MTSNKFSQSPHTLRLNSDLCECERLYQFLSNFTHQNKISDDVLHDFKLAAEEIFANIINHGYQKAPGHIIDISISTCCGCITISFSDKAIAYNPLKPSYTSNCENDRCEGGMGLQIIQSVTDTQNYERINDRNVLIITKHYTIQK